MMHKDEIHSSEPEGRFTAESDIVFLVFTRQNPTVGQIIQLENLDSLLSTNFNPANPTRFLIHGWNGGANAGSNNAPRNAYLEVGEFNVIVVDWGAGANSNYITSRNRVGAVGAVVGRFIDFLVLQTEHRLDQIYVTGFSLGGHAAGFVGKHVTVGTVHTIVALDPAGPLFSATDPTVRVDASDAEYVEVIITNGGILGLMEPVGTANFYPNGGRSQPGCGIDISGNCAHGRAPAFHTESIRTTVGFWSSQCESIDNMSIESCVGPRFAFGGEPGLHGFEANGIFFLETGSASPFALG